MNPTTSPAIHPTVTPSRASLVAPVSAAELEAWVAERVAPFKRLRGIRFVDQVPRSPTGKLLRRVLVEAERADAARAEAPAEPEPAGVA